MELGMTKSPWSRRTFLGSGIAVGAGSAAAALAPTDLFGTSTAYSPPQDLVLQEILRQFEGAVFALQGRPNGESARRIAASLRMLASWGIEQRVDDDVRRQLRDAIRREGREAIVTRPFVVRRLTPAGATSRTSAHSPAR